MNRAICLVIGYLFGSYLTAVSVAKDYGKDVREIDPQHKGEGNPGMANVMLNIGFKAGLKVLFGDIMKVILAMIFCYFFFYRLIGMKAFLYCGFGSILGHNFPFSQRFKGGKGILVTGVWSLIIIPLPALFSLLAGALIAAITGYLNLAAIVSPLILIPCCFVLKDCEYGVLMVLASIMLIYRNRKDLLMIIRGEMKPVDFFKQVKKVEKAQ